jgi:uncharacterized protein
MSIKKNDPLRLDVSYLVKSSPGTHKEFDFIFPQLTFSSDLTLVDIQGSIAVSVTEDGVVAEGMLTALTQLSCSRCLDDYWQPLNLKFTEMFAAHPVDDMENGTLEQPLPADGSIDLSPILRDYAALDIPIRQLCSPECKGLCQVCGINLNRNDCGHERESLDPRLAGLKQLLENKERTE